MIWLIIVQSLFSCLSIIFIPYVIGSAILPDNVSYKKLYSWFFGFFFIVILFIVIEISYLKILIKNFVFIILVIAILSSIKFTLNYKRNNKINFKSILKTVHKNFIFVVVVLVGLLPAIIASLYIPYPLFGLNHDQPKSIFQPIYRIFEDGVPQFDIRYGEIVLVSVASLPFNYDPMQAAYILRFVLLAVYAIFLYRLFFEVFKNNVIAFLSMVVALMANNGFYYHPYNMLFFDVPAQHFRGNTVIFVLLPLLLLLTLKESEGQLRFKERLKLVLIAFSISFTFSLFAFYPYEYIYKTGQYYKHIYIDPYFYAIVPLFIFCLFYYKFAYKTSMINELLLKLFVIFMTLHFLHREEAFLFYILFLSLFLFNTYIVEKFLRVLAIIFPVYLSSFFLINFSNLPVTLLTKGTWSIDERFKFYEFLAGNGSITMFLYILGVLILSYRILKRNENLCSRFEKMLCLFNFLVLFVYFFPVTWTYRAFKALSVCMGFVVGSVLAPMTRSKISTYARYLMLILIIILVIDGSYSVNRRFSYLYPGMKYQTALYDYEYEAAFWMRGHLPKNVILVSDYFTIWTLTPLSNKIWPMDEYMLFLGMPDHLKINVYIIKDKILKADNAQIAYENLKYLIEKLPIQEKIYIQSLGFRNLSVAIVITPRTIAWLNSNSYDSFIYSPPGCVDPNAPVLKKFYDRRYFVPVYNSCSVLIFVTTNSLPYQG
jgi:hypothetical protein